MSNFFGRKAELESLKNLLYKKTASLVVIKGRRRVGKSRLLEEFSVHFPKSYFFSGLAPTEEELPSAQSQRDEFIGQMIRQDIDVSNLNKEDWGDLFWRLSQYTSKDSYLIVLDEITWMGSGDPNFLGKLKNAWDLYFKKNDKLILAICGSASAWIEENILSSTGFLGRESLNLTLEELPLKDCIQFWHTEKDKVSAHEKLKILSVTGGIPRYLEHINPFLSADDNISRMCFTKTGILYKEFDKIFSDLFTAKAPLYKKIVTILSQGIADQQTIVKSLDLTQGGDITEHLENLIQSGFVSRDFTWKFQDGKRSNLSHYRLKDNYSRFYLKYIFPNNDRIANDNMTDISLNNLPGWHAMMGNQIENLVLSNRKLIKEVLQINPTTIISDNPYFQRKTQNHEGCQIDYLIQTQYNTLYICEIKYSKNPVDYSVVEEMQTKLKRLKIPKHFSFRPVLIHVNGVREAVEDSQFFSKIIDFGGFLSDA
jgi:uncharacterized protein